MSTFKISGLSAAMLFVLGGCMHVPPAQIYGIGKTPTAAEIAGWDIDVRADGAGLPAGFGSVAQGKVIYQAKCAMCHGANGEKGPAPRLTGGQGTLASKNPIMTVGSFWPYATTLYDYINRSMPFDRPQTLTSDEVYAVTAYTLNMNGIVGADAILDARTLPKVEMPNRRGFTSQDPRPDTGR